VFKRYYSSITFMRVLPTRWRRKPAGMNRNYVTVALCRNVALLLVVRCSVQGRCVIYRLWTLSSLILSSWSRHTLLGRCGINNRTPGQIVFAPSGCNFLSIVIHRHFVGITRHDTFSKMAKIYRVIQSCIS